MLGGININKNIDLEKDENYYQMLQYTQNYMKDQGIEISISELESLIDENGFEEQSDIENSVIDDEKTIAEMEAAIENQIDASEYVVRGALLKCEYGSHCRKLNLPKCHGVKIMSHPVMNDSDILAGLGDDSDKNIINIPSFGICDGPNKGQIGEGTIDLKKDNPRNLETGEITGEAPDGIITGKRCNPNFTDNWQSSYGKTKIGNDGNYAITTNSFLVCKYGGTITVINSGQQNEPDEENN